MDLKWLFDQINQKHFDAFLDYPELVFNSRLSSSAGRFFPGSRSVFFPRAPKIEIASYLMDESEADALILDTLAHEMIHYWLWVRRRPYGHTPEFTTKMRQMGVSRFNSAPKFKAHRYMYICPNCKRRFPARKKLSKLACAQCCKQFNEGRYSDVFRLEVAIVKIQNTT